MPFCYDKRGYWSWINVGKWTFAHITQFLFPSAVYFQAGIWDGTSVLIPKPAPGSVEIFSGIVLRVHGRETEELGPDRTPNEVEFWYLKNKKAKGQEPVPNSQSLLRSNGGMLYTQWLNCDYEAITYLTNGRHSKVKQPRHVIAEYKRLHDLSKDRFLAWQRLNVLRIKKTVLVEIDNK